MQQNEVEGLNLGSKKINLCICLVSFCYGVGIGLLRNGWKRSDQTHGAWAKGGGTGVSRSTGWRVDVRGQGKGRKREDLTGERLLAQV